MEHIIQFAIGIDDKAIVERIEKNAEKQIIQSIEQAVKGEIFEKDWSGEVREYSPLSNYSKRLLVDFFERNREEIIDKAADHLAERLLRTKKGKELLKKEDV